MRAAQQIPLFDLGDPDITPAMIKHLRLLEAARPAGIPRHGVGYADFAGRRIARIDAIRLSNRDLARLDWRGRTPRLKITRQGLKVLAASETAR